MDRIKRNPARRDVSKMTTAERGIAISQLAGNAFFEMEKLGFDVVDINAVVMGMTRRSMEALVGRDQAIQWDESARERIGWAKTDRADPATASIPEPEKIATLRAGFEDARKCGEPVEGTLTDATFAYVDALRSRIAELEKQNAELEEMVE